MNCVHNNPLAIYRLKFLGVIVFLVSILSTTQLLAQEKQDFPNGENIELNQPPDGHIVSIKEKEVVLDSLAIKPNPIGSGKADAANKAKPEEDALSFNFLYFIIQKFKVSDIVD